MKTKFLAVVALTLLLVLACQSDSMDESIELDMSSPIESNYKSYSLNKSSIHEVQFKSKNKKRSSADNVHELMSAINSALANNGLSIQLSKVEYYSADGTGNEVLFGEDDRGNKQLASDFVPGDLRRGFDGAGNIGSDNIHFLSDGTEANTVSGLTNTDTDTAIRNAMNTWENVDCSKGLNFVDFGSVPSDWGFVQYLLSFEEDYNGPPGSPFVTDIMHSGFTTGLFEFIFGSGSNVLGVTFTFLFCAPCTDDSSTTVYTDIDNNGKFDTGFRDIYYNDAFRWSIGAGGVDVETVALHETGHALGQAHFGKLFRTESNEKVHFAPRAVMNAGYTGIQTAIDQTDKAGHCSNWGQWPNN